MACESCFASVGDEHEPGCRFAGAVQVDHSTVHAPCPEPECGAIVPEAHRVDCPNRPGPGEVVPCDDPQRVRETAWADPTQPPDAADAPTILVSLISALDPLTPSARVRVLAAVRAWFGLES